MIIKLVLVIVREFHYFHTRFYLRKQHNMHGNRTNKSDNHEAESIRRFNCVVFVAEEVPKHADQHYVRDNKYNAEEIKGLTELLVS